MNFVNLALIQNLLAALGITEAAVQAWVDAYKAAHPDQAGLADAFWQWVASHVADTNVSAALHAAFTDLAGLVQTGKGPISAETDPTSLA